MELLSIKQYMTKYNYTYFDIPKSINKIYNLLLCNNVYNIKDSSSIELIYLKNDDYELCRHIEDILITNNNKYTCYGYA
jgi:hypothetical protein